MTIVSDVTPGNYWDAYDKWKASCKIKLVKNGYLIKNKVALMGYVFRTLIIGLFVLPGTILLALLLITGILYPQGVVGVLVIDVWTLETAAIEVAEANQLLLLIWLISGTVIAGMLSVVKPWVSPLNVRLNELMARWIADHIEQNPGIANSASIKHEAASRKRL